MNYSSDIRNIYFFYKNNNRLPYFFTKSDNEKSLNKTMHKLIDLYDKRSIKDDKYENIKFFKNNIPYFIKKEIDENIIKISSLINKNDIKLDSYVYNYPNYLIDFINFYRFSKDKLSQNIIKKLETIPGWIWGEKNYFDDMLDKLYYFCKTNNRLPNSSNDEHKLYTFMNDIYYRYVYDLLSNERLSKIKSITLFSLNDYKNVPGLSFLSRYLVEYKDNDFFNEFLNLYNFFCSKNELPDHNHDLYINVINIRKMYYDMKLSFLEIKMMEELKGWKWSFDLIVDKEYDASKTSIPMFTDNKYIDSLLSNSSQTFIRKNYNFKNNVYNLKTNKLSKRHREERLSKKKALLRISIINKIEKGELLS